MEQSVREDEYLVKTNQADGDRAALLMGVKEEGIGVLPSTNF